MPLDKSIKKVLIIGSGPIIIGQAAEFDYAGTQALRALKEEGIEMVLINSNPATIMTDNTMADKIYIEPLTLATVKRIIEKEKPDSILSGLGGQTGLTLSMQLAKDGFLKKHNIKLLGASESAIDKAEDRQMFKDTMSSINQPLVPSLVVTDVESALKFAEEITYPVIVRPAFTLGGTGGGIAENVTELTEIAKNGLAASPIKQILVEKCIAGWKEIEFEVIRDQGGNVITVCSMENLDPVGIHTGDSIVIAPAVTLADKEYQMLRTAAISIVTALGVEGGCNCQFALEPNSFEYAVIEVNPRVSRSSALASKATGYPIAKVATKVAIGYRLDEIMNAVTGKTYAAFEPALDYVAVKFPKWPFDKFVYAKRELGTQMKATGEVMSIADTFEMAILKAVRGAEISLDTLNYSKMESLSDEELIIALKKQATDERLFVVYEALKRNYTIDEIFDITKIDRWFLYKMLNLVNYERKLKIEDLTHELYTEGKKYGYTDRAIERISGKKVTYKRMPTYKMVDTCGGEFAALTPYFYSTYDTIESGGENEALEFINTCKKETVIVIGSGPIRIGQGIEFDYASVHCVWALKRLGYNVVIINNNPETVSTDFDTADRLYFEPLTPEDVQNIIDIEKPIGVVVAFGGQTAIKLTRHLSANNIPIIGTSADSIDMAEDRERFEALLESINIKRPKGYTVNTTEEALIAARKLDYPVLMRPSYVLGGQNMIIAFNDDDIKEYMKIILVHKDDSPILIDKYLSGIEIEVDAICDGQDILIPGIMEHIERTGIHSGDSIAVYPATHIDDELAEDILNTTRKICLALKARGLVNLQYIIIGREIYVIEVNPRASRTVPYLSKVTGVKMCDAATRVSLNETLDDLEYGKGLFKTSPYIAVKVPVFSFEKLTDLDTQLGPEMKSTGEVLGMGKSLEEALCKGLIAAGYKMVKKGGVFISVKDSDKKEIADIAKKYDKLGFKLYATKGTADNISKLGLKVNVLGKLHENNNALIKLLESGAIKYIISTSAKGRNPARDSVKIRRKAVQLGIPCLTSIDTASAMADSLKSRYSEHNTELININELRPHKFKMPFVKMQGTGNDFICIDIRNMPINSPESLAIHLSDRHYGVGADGIVLISNSREADASVRMFNLDGSECKICGNGIRCVAKYIYDNKIINKRHMQIETLSGIKDVTVRTKDSLVYNATVDMGAVELNPTYIPVNIKADKIVNHKIDVDGEELKITAVGMGDCHIVLFYDEIETCDLNRLGNMLEFNKMFPDRANTDIVEIIDKNTIKIRVYESGCGETLGCGTGACASAVAAVLNGHCNKNEDIRVILLGGELIIKYTEDGRVIMTGATSKVFEGVVEI